MSPPGGSDLLVLARRVLLDAIQALEGQRDALILIGAQAIYIHTEAAPIALPEATKDSDIAIDRRQLVDDPLLEEAMTRAGFRSGANPGSWLSSFDVPVDLMMPETMSDPGGTRGARKPPHSPRATRRAAGLEAAIVDNDWREISSLDVTDGRKFMMRVAGPAALLIAKMHKLGERHNANIARLVDKDAHDVYRLLTVVPTESLAATLASLREDDLAREAAETGLRYLSDLFAAGPDALGCVMAGRAEELIGDPAFVSQATAFLAHDLVRSSPLCGRRIGRIPWVFGGLGCSGRVYRTATTGARAMSSRASAWSAVGWVSFSNVLAWPCSRVVLRVWVASSASRVR